MHEHISEELPIEMPIMDKRRHHRQIIYKTWIYARDHIYSDIYEEQYYCTIVI